MARNRIVDRLRSDQALAEWRAAEAFLEESDGLIVPALERIRSLVGLGLTASESELLSDLVRTLARERNARG